MTSIRMPQPAARITATAAALAGIALALAGCATTAEAEPASDSTETVEATPTETETAKPTETATAEPEPDSVYTDGTYTANGSYQAPSGTESVDVSITVADDVVTAVTVTGSASGGQSARYQGEFIGGIADAVVGQPLEGLSVSRIAGSSLTSGGFDAALDQIRAAAVA